MPIIRLTSDGNTSSRATVAAAIHHSPLPPTCFRTIELCGVCHQRAPRHNNFIDKLLTADIRGAAVESVNLRPATDDALPNKCAEPADRSLVSLDVVELTLFLLERIKKFQRVQLSTSRKLRRRLATERISTDSPPNEKKKSEEK